MSQAGPADGNLIHMDRSKRARLFHPAIQNGAAGEYLPKRLQVLSGVTPETTRAFGHREAIPPNGTPCAYAAKRKVSGPAPTIGCPQLSRQKIREESTAGRMVGNTMLLIMGVIWVMSITAGVVLALAAAFS